jgi:hypothetical protein
MDPIKQGVDVNNEEQATDAYERVKADLAALKTDELLQVNLDIPTAVTTILGVLPELRALRERMSKELPTFDLAAFDKLEDFALALSATQTSYLTATQPPDDLQALATEAGVLHDRLLADAKALAQHGLIDSKQIDQLLGGNSYKSLAQDLQILSKVMQENWAKIQGKTPTLADELKIANQMSTRLMRIIGVREQSPALLAAAAEARMRAFTQLIRVYQDARRAVTYLRGPEGDADSIAPTLYPGRPKRRQPEPPPGPAPQTPVVTPTAGAIGTDSTAEMPAVSADAATAVLAAQKGAPASASKGPFLS